MSDILNPNKEISLSIANKQDAEMIRKISHALDSPERIKILRSILYKSKGLQELSTELNIPISSIMRHVDILTDAQLIIINYQPGLKGHAKYCSQTILSFTVSLDVSDTQKESEQEYVLELPIGHFSHCHITTPCGMNGKDAQIGKYDDKRSFFLPERINAELLWFEEGFITYNFATPPEDLGYSSVSFSFEICSETVYFNNNWPSDITLYVNDIEILTFTSPGDFGGRRGTYTPDYWPLTSTQYGLLKKIIVNDFGVYFDGKLVSRSITFDDLHVFDHVAVKFTIGIKPDAKHKGGINLFGKNFGDYNQAIVMKIR
ncbi:MAG: transcriptional regulator [Clostridia bacterium]|nr:transcriptional regulator [Clostridia bacterium]